MKIGTKNIVSKHFGSLEVLKEVFNGSVVYERAPSAYEIGFRGMSSSSTSLTRTGDASSADWTATSGVISVSGIDMTKIFGGYVGNDGEELTWDSTTLKYKNGSSDYTGNVFVKINRFFIKPIYENSVLDGFDLCFADSAPDSSYQDWFLGKDHCIVGCYKARGGGYSNGLQSKQGLTFMSATSANDIVTAYKLNSSTAYSLHEKWYNENAILQVLFMAIFATKQTEDVFPQATYRHRSNDTRATGYMDSYRASSLLAYEPTGNSGYRGNMFLGIEDFVGWGYELVAGVKLSGTSIAVSMDYASFSYSGTYTASSCSLPSASGYNIETMQIDDSNVGLMIPKTASGSTYTTYFCDGMWTGGNCWYQGANTPFANVGVFSFNGIDGSSNSTGNCAGRLCGKPL